MKNSSELGSALLLALALAADADASTPPEADAVEHAHTQFALLLGGSVPVQKPNSVDPIITVEAIHTPPNTDLSIGVAATVSPNPEHPLYGIHAPMGYHGGHFAAYLVPGVLAQAADEKVQASPSLGLEGAAKLFSIGHLGVETVVGGHFHLHEGLPVPAVSTSVGLTLGVESHQ